MLVEVTEPAQARRLELDGFSRTGRKAIETGVAQLANILERDDVSVRKVVLSRKNGQEEADIIDREIKKHSGKVKQEYVVVKSHGDTFRRRTRTLMHVEEDSLQIRRDFRQVVRGDYSLVATSEEEFQERKDGAINDLIAKIEELEEEIEDVQATELPDIVDYGLDGPDA